MRGKHLKQAAPDLGPEFVLSRAEGVADQPKDFDWVAKNIPCQAACPAGTDIPGYLDAIAHGRYDEAYRINLIDNVFPAALGRVCTRPCEPACRHGWEGLGDPVAICFSKRSAEEFMRQKKPVVLDPWFGPTGRRVAVIGAGAAGLTVARQLALYGHAVTVYEKHHVAGGMMVLGIPAFRLPRDLIEREVEQIRLQGVDIRCGIEVGVDLSLQDAIDDFDAVVVSPGTQRPFLPDLPGVHLRGIRHGLEFLMEFNTADTASVGRRVLVIGGGFTAVDCARSAQRLGAESVRMCYRRSSEEMYITPGEIEEMEAEGIAFDTLIAPVAFQGADGRVSEVAFLRVELGELDASGRRAPSAIPGSEFTVPADTVLLATGQTQDTSWTERWIPPGVREGHETDTDRLFVAGDFATGSISLIDAIGSAKECARNIDLALMGEDRVADVVTIEDSDATGRTREMDKIPRQVMPTLPIEKRLRTEEVETGFAEAAARVEARRCYLCHYKYEIDNDLCIYCDRCLKVKPVDRCIVKVSELEHDDAGRISGYRESTGSRDYNMLFIDQNECIRCGACADVCPVECITLQKVQLSTVRCCDR